MLGGKLLKPNAFTDANGTVFCNKSQSGPLWQSYCNFDNETNSWNCDDDYFNTNDPKWIPGIPGFSVKSFSGLIKQKTNNFFLLFVMKFNISSLLLVKTIFTLCIWKLVKVYQKLKPTKKSRCFKTYPRVSLL